MSNVANIHDRPFLKAKYDLTTFDEMPVKASSDFIDKAKRKGKPFLIWHNITRMHVWTFLWKKYGSTQNSQTNYDLEEAGNGAARRQWVGALLKHLDDIGEANNTIVTENGAEVFTWRDGGMTPFKNTKGTVGEGGFRVPRAFQEKINGAHSDRKQPARLLLSWTTATGSIGWRTRLATY